MKQLIKVIGGFLVLFGVVFTLYGLMKGAKADTEVKNEIKLQDGIIQAQSSPSEQLSEIGLTTGVVMIVIGGVLFILSGSKR